jgi:hypothetical protein
MGGDTLSGIATKNKTSLNDVLNLNPQYRANPNLIKPGEIINLKNSTGQPTTPNITTNPSGVGVNSTTGGVVPPPVIPTAPPAPVIPETTPPIVPPAPVVPPPPTGQGYYSPEYKAKEAAYASNLQITPEEEANQTQLDNLLSSTRLGVAGKEGQGRGIPLELIRGQQAQMEKQGLLLTQPLQARAALLQAKRTAALEASKFKLEQEGKKIDYTGTQKTEKGKLDAEASKPVNVSPGSSLVNPTTGRVIYTAPEKIKEKESDSNIGKTVKADNGKTLMWNTMTQKYDIPIGEGGMSESDTTNLVVLQSKAKIIDSILTNPDGTDNSNIDKIVGTSALDAAEFNLSYAAGTTQDLILNVEQMIDKETLDTLLALKKAGGTLGALSEKEADMLRSAATKLGGARVMSMFGNKVIGYRMSKTAFVDEIKVLKELTAAAMSRVTGGESTDEGFSW